MMLFGTNPESQPLRYFYILHAFETLVVARYAPAVLSLENVATLRRIATPFNWDFDAWTARMQAIHAGSREVPEGERAHHLGQAVAAAVHEFTERTPIRTAFKDKKMREDVLFFTMLTYVDELFQYWVSGAPGAPRVLDPPTFTDFMLVDRTNCISVKTMLALMLYGRKRDHFTERALNMLGGKSGPLQAHASSLADKVMYTPCKEPTPAQHTMRTTANTSSRATNRHRADHRDMRNHGNAQQDDATFADTFDFGTSTTTRVPASVDATGRASRHTDEIHSTREFDMLFGSEVPYTHFARIMEMRTVDMGLVILHMSSKYCSEVCCFESTARVARAQREADRRKQEMERKRLVQKSALALQ